MEFTEYKCPICNEQFKSGDDIVVCPECGTPQHRECYENLGHCFYESKHSEGFSFGENDGESTDCSDGETEGTVICPMCRKENDKTSFYCKKCGYPLNAEDRKTNQSSNNSQQPFTQGTPFGYAGSGMPAFDPLAGLDSEQEIADNVTVGEMSKFVGKSTQYFLLVFNKIKSFGSSRFNFAAFLFSGVYFLYRKMLTLGIILSVLTIGLTIAEALVFISPEYQNCIATLLSSESGTQMLYSMSLGSMFSPSELFLIYSPYVISILRGVIMLISGFVANRTYYKHCTKKINAIKSKFNDTSASKKLEAAGGVNLPLAVCVGIASLVINYIPLFM